MKKACKKVAAVLAIASTLALGPMAGSAFAVELPVVGDGLPTEGLTGGLAGGLPTGGLTGGLPLQ